MLGDDDDSPTAELLLSGAGTRAPSRAPGIAGNESGIGRRGAHSWQGSDTDRSDFLGHSCIDGAELVEIFEAFCEEAEEEGRGGGGVGGGGGGGGGGPGGGGGGGRGLR